LDYWGLADHQRLSFGIEDDRSTRKLPNCLCDLRIAIAPFCATSAKERDIATVLVDLNAEAVELDLVLPAFSGRRFFPGCRSAGGYK
jgi:hypothetical protein